MRSVPARARREPVHNGGGTPAVAGDGDPLERLERLAALHDRGALTDEEFSEQKQELLAVH